MGGLGDAVSCIVLLGLIRETTDHLAPEVLAIEGPLPDHLRRPVRKAALAERLGMPAETLRRHLGTLEARGFCRPVDGGMVAAAAPPGLAGVQVLVDNALNVQRLAAKLARAGGLSWWEAEAAADAAGAASAASAA